MEGFVFGLTYRIAFYYQSLFARLVVLTMLQLFFVLWNIAKPFNDMAISSSSSSSFSASSSGPSFMNCPYHALNDVLRGARYGHREGCYSCFIGPFEDARHPYSRHNLYPLPPWRRALLPLVKPCLYEASRSWLAGLNFRATMTSQHGASDPTDWPWHIAARHFLFRPRLAASIIRCRAWM